MGATTTAFFARAGTYVFITGAGEDYMSGFHTIGAAVRLANRDSHQH